MGGQDVPPVRFRQTGADTSWQKRTGSKKTKIVYKETKKNILHTSKPIAASGIRLARDRNLSIIVELSLFMHFYL